ncbi:rod-determining factor RdfA [Haloarchaeobius sp. TZWSO28]|uniref:rod-determining factor RdfA n=1 Tax=unclassified Haloarchaeobius TaxID=2614452 RepID=UPI003EBEE166
MAGCKVCRVLAKYDAEYYDERLIQQWTAPKPERKGYRQLADWLNSNLLRQEMDKVGMSTLAGEVESKYERLQGDSTTAIELEQQLESEGVRIDELTDDFVSYGVIRRHLKECLEATREETTTEWEETSIEIATARAEQKVSEAVQSLLNKGKVDSSENVRVTLTAELECEECQTRIPVDRALRRGYLCSCASTDTNER